VHRPRQAATPRTACTAAARCSGEAHAAVRISAPALQRKRRSGTRMRTEAQRKRRLVARAPGAPRRGTHWSLGRSGWPVPSATSSYARPAEACEALPLAVSARSHAARRSLALLHAPDSSRVVLP
jgi:hypothetical protein